VPHVALTKVAEYTAEAAKAGGPDDASLGMLWHKLSELPVVTIAKLRGRARGSTGRCPTPNWTLSWPGSRDASRRSPPMQCDPPSRCSTNGPCPARDAIRANARRFQQLAGSDTVKARAATLFAQGLQTRGPLELDLGDRIESL
jgi:hypothetical protein